MLALFRVRVLAITHPDRIGHLAVEPDCYIKEGRLGLRRELFSVLVVPRSKVANGALLELWAKQLPVVASDFWYAILSPLAKVPYISHSLAPYAVAIDDTATCAAIQARWHGRPSLLSLSDKAAGEGRSRLRELGLPAGAWFVCVHSREGGYSSDDEHLHSYRNSDIGTYRLAMEAIVARGGWCIRMGDASSKALPRLEGVIDYAHSSLKGDAMDVFLCASCRFFLGNSSGLAFLASVFGVPNALANLVPVSSSLPLMPDDIGIPKILQRRHSREALKFTEILSSPIGNYRFASLYSKEGIVVVDNDAEDIRDLAVEMLDICAQRVDYTQEDQERQLRFQALMRPGHYSFGAASRVGRSFLRRYAELLG